MDKYQIQTLLAKYFEGNTTLEEERILRTYFAGDLEIDPELITYRNHFKMIDSGRFVPPYNQDTIDHDIMDRIMSVEKSQHPVVRKIRYSKLLIAASVALIAGISGLVFYKVQNQTMHDTYQNPKLAYMETQKTLLYISGKINKGIEPLSNVSKINTATENLQNLEKMDKSLSMLNLVSFINKSSNLKK
jgi:hypothetical protein